MPKIARENVPASTMSVYPQPFDARVSGRAKQPLGNAVGLDQFGVNCVRLVPGGASSLKHWHENEDEFVFILEGTPLLIEGETETLLQPGDSAGFKAGVAVGHHLVNRSGADVVYLEVGSRARAERVHYPDDDLVYEKINAAFRFSRRDGSPY